MTRCRDIPVAVLLTMAVGCVPSPESCLQVDLAIREKDGSRGPAELCLVLRNRGNSVLAVPLRRSGLGTGAARREKRTKEDYAHLRVNMYAAEHKGMSACMGSYEQYMVDPAEGWSWCRWNPMLENPTYVGSERDDVVIEPGGSHAIDLRGMADDLIELGAQSDRLFNIAIALSNEHLRDAEMWRKKGAGSAQVFGTWPCNVRALRACDLLIKLLLARYNGPPGKAHTLRQRNEEMAVAVLRTYAEAQRKYRMKDHDGDQVFEYASSLVHLDKDPHSGKIELIDEAIAMAARENYPRGTLVPYAGYFLVDLTGDGRDAAYADGKGNYVSGFGLCAVPVEYDRSGRYTFVIDARGTVYRKDTKGKLVTEYPDIEEEGWELVGQ